MYVCICNAVTDEEIREAIRNGYTDFEDLQDCLGICIMCQTCEPMCRSIIKEELDK